MMIPSEFQKEEKKMHLQVSEVDDVVRNLLHELEGPLNTGVFMTSVRDRCLRDCRTGTSEHDVIGALRREYANGSLVYRIVKDKNSEALAVVIVPLVTDDPGYFKVGGTKAD